MGNKQQYKKREGINKMRNSRGVQIKRANILSNALNRLIATDTDEQTTYPKIGTSYILGVDKGSETFGDMSAVTILEQYSNGPIKVLGCGTGEDIDAAINKLKEECKDVSIDVDKLVELAKSVGVSGAYTLGVNYRDMEDMTNTIPKSDLLFHANYPFISKDPTITFNLVKKRFTDIAEKPKCFNKCVDQYCNMTKEHCSNRDFPPMSKCTRCNFWFTNLEREEYQQIKDRHLSRIMDEVTIFRGE
jgi:hypothetical protein